jgi:tetratricopeptide (TPR) repeat protein
MQRPSSSTAAMVGVDRSMTHPETTGAGETPLPQRTTTAAGSDHERPVPAADERADTAARARPLDRRAATRMASGAGRRDDGGAHDPARLIAREPKHVRARQVLAELIAQKGDLEGAISELSLRTRDRAGRRAEPVCAGRAVRRARQVRSGGVRSQARGEARRPRPGRAGAARSLFCKRARWREAIEPLRAAVAADPQHAAAHYHLGDAYNAVDDLPAALGAYERAAQLEPTNARPLLRIGVVLDRLGRNAEAAAAYRRARAAQGR